MPERIFDSKESSTIKKVKVAKAVGGLCCAAS